MTRRDGSSSPLPSEQYLPGVLPVDSPSPSSNHPNAPRSNAATAATAASVRALSAQAIQFYFRAPVKAFFRTRVDYLAWARSTQTPLHPGSSSSVWTWLRATTPGVLGSAISRHGWGVVPEQILPPLIANVGVGAVLYTSYLQILAQLHEESGRSSRRVYPPPEPKHTFTAGLLAGSIQSVVAAPLDAIQARYDHRDMVEGGSNGRPRSMWSFSREKLREIGFRGIFAGWGLSFLKDSCGSAVFFTTFEWVKAQGYYKFVKWYYGGLSEGVVALLARRRPHDSEGIESKNQEKQAVIRPHYAIEPMFLLLAGISASFTQQFILHPLTHIQVIHWDRLEDLDAKATAIRSSEKRPEKRWRMFRAYYHAYQETWAACRSNAAAEGQGPWRWLFRGFWWNTIRQVPSTSAGLIIFELVRRKYGMDQDEVRISRDGYDILLK